ncbi:Sip1-related alpha-galactosidase [Bifidobacterium catenulatum subsp. kashiwanohense]|uniref:Sip1-related alpha-galactosidase n=1 Tax=Bifidobacterium catenulatum TaxID=1686 RepID=UPI003D080B84
MKTATCPIAIRSAMAHLVRGDDHSCFTWNMPSDMVQMAEEADTACPVWSIGLDTRIDQPADRAARFQEQDAYDSFRAVEVGLDVGMPNDGDILALYQHKEWWMRPSWETAFADIPERTQLLLWRSSDMWCVMLAACGDDVRADMGVSDGLLRLRASINAMGFTQLTGMLCAVAVSDDPYRAIHECVRVIAARTHIRMRSERAFPQELTGLGWCTWDSLGQDVSERAIIAKMEEFRRKNVPISWVLIDDGWSDVDRENGMLRSFGADPDRFPQGLSHTVRLLKDEFGVKHVGVWQAFQGYWNGIDSHGEVARRMNGDLTRTANGCLLPGKTDGQAFAFWHKWDKELERSGIDFVKVDSQSSTSVMTSGMESYGEATIGRHEGLDSAVARHFNNALINCMGMAPEDYWHRPISPIVRSSDDYLPHNPRSLAEHVMQNAFNALLMGELYHCDWDMFWSEHPHAWAHGIMRVLSGGPVYCSDAEGHTDEGMLRGLLCPGDEVPRPDSPGLPTLDSLLRDPRKSATALGIHACFGERDVTAYLGLCEGHEQEARIIARRPGRVIRPESGDVRLLQAGESISERVSYGEVMVFEE